MDLVSLSDHDTTLIAVGAKSLKTNDDSCSNTTEENITEKQEDLEEL